MNHEDPLEQLLKLTERQREVLGLVCDSLSYKAIGEKLFITEGAVKAHMANVYITLGLEHLRREQRRQKLFEVCQFSPDDGPPVFGQIGPLRRVTLEKLQAKANVTIDAIKLR